MAEGAALDVSGTNCTDFTRADGAWVVIVTEAPGQPALRRLDGGRLAHGARVIFRATLRPESADRTAIAVHADEVGRFGALPRDTAARFAPVMEQLAKAGRVAICRGYLVGNGDGIEARLLLHEPDECLRRLELDLDSARSH